MICMYVGLLTYKPTRQSIIRNTNTKPLLPWKSNNYNIKYSKCSPVALAIQQAKCMRLWPVWQYHIFPYYLIHGRSFKKKSY